MTPSPHQPNKLSLHPKHSSTSFAKKLSEFFPMETPDMETTPNLREVPAITGVSFLVLRRIPCTTMNVLTMMSEASKEAEASATVRLPQGGFSLNPPGATTILAEPEEEDRDERPVAPVVQFCTDTQEVSRYDPVTFIALESDGPIVLAILPYYLKEEPKTWLGEDCVLLSRHRLRKSKDRVHYAQEISRSIDRIQQGRWKTDWWRNFLPTLEAIFTSLGFVTIMAWSQFLDFFKGLTRLKFFAHMTEELKEQPFLVHLDANKQASKLIHETLSIMDPGCLSDYRQFEIVRCLRESKFFLLAVPSYRHTVRLRTDETPTILGLCVYHFMEIFGTNTTELRVHSLSVLQDCRRNGMATRIIHDLSSRCPKMPICFLVDANRYLEMAMLLKKLGATMEVPDLRPNKTTYRFVLTRERLMQAEAL